MGVWRRRRRGWKKGRWLTHLITITIKMIMIKMIGGLEDVLIRESNELGRCDEL